MMVLRFRLEAGIAGEREFVSRELFRSVIVRLTLVEVFGLEQFVKRIARAFGSLFLILLGLLYLSNVISTLIKRPRLRPRVQREQPSFVD